MTQHGISRSRVLTMQHVYRKQRTSTEEKLTWVGMRRGSTYMCRIGTHRFRTDSHSALLGRFCCAFHFQRAPSSCD